MVMVMMLVVVLVVAVITPGERGCDPLTKNTSVDSEQNCLVRGGKHQFNAEFSNHAKFLELQNAQEVPGSQRFRSLVEETKCWGNRVGEINFG